MNDVTSLGGVLDRGVLELRKVLPGESKNGRSVLGLESDEVSGRGLVSVRGSPDGTVGESPQPSDGLNRLVSRSILSESDGAGKKEGEGRSERDERKEGKEKERGETHSWVATQMTWWWERAESRTAPAA